LAWSLKEYGTESVGISAQKEDPPPILSKKRRDQILWAFPRANVYNGLKRLVDESGCIKTVLITGKEDIPQLESGVIGFGEIRKDDLIGELKWEYWPVKTGWDHKFFIRVTRLGPKVMNSLSQLKNWHSMDISQIKSIIIGWNESIIDLIPKRLTRGSFVEIKQKTYERLSLLANLEWRPERQKAVEKEQEAIKDLIAVIAAHLISGKND
jgi:hypothetical protein